MRGRSGRRARGWRRMVGACVPLKHLVYTRRQVREPELLRLSRESRERMRAVAAGQTASTSMPFFSTICSNFAARPPRRRRAVRLAEHLRATAAQTRAQLQPQRPRPQPAAVHRASGGPQRRSPQRCRTRGAWCACRRLGGLIAAPVGAWLTPQGVLSPSQTLSGLDVPSGSVADSLRAHSCRCRLGIDTPDRNTPAAECDQRDLPAAQRSPSPVVLESVARDRRF